MKKLCVEGWRGINHSYAMVNQWQLLELVNHPIHLRHKDVPYFNKYWNSKDNACGFPAEQHRIISSIENPAADESFDTTYRISFPYNIGHSSSQRLIIFGTAEYQSIEDCFINGNLTEASRSGQVSIVTPSAWSKVGFIKAGFIQDRIHVVPHGVDPKTFYPFENDDRIQIRNELGLKEDDFALLSLGAMTENKGIDLLIVAFAMLRARHKTLKLLLKDQSNLYGMHAQDYLVKLRETRYGALLTTDVVSNIYFVSQNLDLKQLHGLYGATDCYVSPYTAEGFNLPPLEAAACGVPIVVTDSGSTDDYFDPIIGLKIASSLMHSGKGSYLEPKLDSLVESLSRIIDRTHACGGVKGSAYVHGRFSWARITDELNRVFFP